MDGKHLNYRLLARYMAGICSDETARYISSWANRSEENAQKLEEFRQIWEAAGHSESIEDEASEVREQWSKLEKKLHSRRMDSAAYSRGKAEDAGADLRPTSAPSTVWQVARVAAIFLVAGLAGVFAYQNWHQPAPQSVEPALREISTRDGQRVNLTLGDGTRVLLNADSHLALPSKFASSKREVFLEGEAFFEVAPNAQKPFVIHSRGSVIRVLGTAFAVRAYPEESHIQVVVKEGRVSLASESPDDSSKSILTANELGRFSVETRQIQARRVEDLQLYLGWRDGYLKFRNAPMPQVARELERRYGITVRFQDDRIKDQKLTAFLKSRSIRNVLDVITTSLDIAYELRENQVTFYRRR